MLRGKKIHAQKPTFDIHVGIHNRFDVEVRDAVSGKIRQRAQALNVVLNQYWNSSAGGFSYIWYGTGTGTPAETDTGMFGTAYKVSASDDSTGFDENTGVKYDRKKITLSETQAVGVTISEVGVGSQTLLCTHAMLQDMNGNPISIQKTDTDIITIYATVYAHYDVEGYNGNKVWFKELTVTQLAHLSRSVPSEVTFIAADGSGSLEKSVTSSYDPTTRTSTVNVPRLKVGEGNYGGLKYMDSLYCCFDLSGDYPITGEAVGTGDGLTTDFELAYDIPKDAKIYVDGVEVTSGVTVYSQPKLAPQCYFWHISYYSTPTSIRRYGSPSINQGKGAMYMYNPYFALGLESIRLIGSGTNTLWASDDMQNWTTIYSGGSATISIPAQFQHTKFWCRDFANQYCSLVDGVWCANVNRQGKMVHFDTPPAPGAVIIADYTCSYVPKDSNHVYDSSFTVSFGNYEGP